MFLSVVLAAALAVLLPPSAQAAPLDIPVPTGVTPDALLSTTDGTGAVSGIVPGARACESADPRAIELPADDAPHADTYIEWWWWRGELETADGRRLSFVKLLASKPWAGFHAFEWGLTDESGTLAYERDLHVPGQPRRLDGGFSAATAGAAVEGVAGHDRLRFEVGGSDVDLRLEPVKPAVRHWGDGSTTGYCHSAFLYTRPRVRITGTVTRDGRPVAVTGHAVVDHHWGFMPAEEIAGWDWFNIRLDDGRDISVIHASPRKGGSEARFLLASVSGPDGTVTEHVGDAVAIRPTRWWRRDATCRYPVGWEIRIGEERLQLNAVHDASEIRGLADPDAYVLWPGWPLYWDGPTVVAGDATGRGWMDLGHYCVA